MYKSMLLAATLTFLKLETSIFLRVDYLTNLALWNTTTAFHPNALPYAYAPGYGLSFLPRVQAQTILP